MVYRKSESVRCSTAARMVRSSLPATLVALALMCACARVSGSGTYCSDECGEEQTCHNGQCVTWSSQDAPPPLADGGSLADAGLCASVTVPFTQTQQVVDVPPNVSYMHIKAWGAGGNGEGSCGSPDYSGGVGGYTEAAFAIDSSVSLIVIVGGAGNAQTVPTWTFGFGASGGGGLSGVFRGPTQITKFDANKAYVIAGGGGSAARNTCIYGGSGNHTDTSIAGGMPTMAGGVGSDTSLGGAGGRRGGTGGGLNARGKGGTGRIDSTALAAPRRRLFTAPGTTERPPRINDPDYQDNAGIVEHNGRVVIHFRCDAPPVQ